MSYWRLFYHFTWATKYRAPLITSEIEDILHERIRLEANLLKSPFVVVNGIEDHVHVLASVRPTIRICDFAKQLKGASSHYIRENLKVPFTWQKGYGVVTVSEQDLDTVERYVLDQKVRHRLGRTIDALERSEGIYGFGGTEPNNSNDG